MPASVNGAAFPPAARTPPIPCPGPWSALLAVGWHRNTPHDLPWFLRPLIDGLGIRRLRQCLPLPGRTQRSTDGSGPAACSSRMRDQNSAMMISTFWTQVSSRASCSAGLPGRPVVPAVRRHVGAELPAVAAVDLLGNTCGAHAVAGHQVLDLHVDDRPAGGQLDVIGPGILLELQHQVPDVGVPSAGHRSRLGGPFGFRFIRATWSEPGSKPWHGAVPSFCPRSLKPSKIRHESLLVSSLVFLIAS